ncbi:S16 family serine protease [Lysinibacillus sp. SGAir0095]|uniref:S16 family serine protease n=1 Tax=Lysinibacillus sp. SGAir0095 TaxID=2070463 RepID=UPI00143CC8F3|nr:S16 family serine protease [Lysinibacillus sp. SGAir0095]
MDDESLIRNSLKQGERDFIDLYKLNNKIRYESKNTEILQWLRIQKDEFSVMKENVKLYLGNIGNIAGFLKREDLTGDSAGLGLVLTELIAQGKLENHITFGVTGAINSTGDVREIGMVKEKILIAEKMGFPYIIIPTDNLEDANEIKKKEKLTIEIIDVKNVDEAIRLVGKLNN